MELNNKKIKWILFCTALIVSSLIIFGPFIFDGKLFIFRDIGIDTFQQYYPYYVSAVERIREGIFGVWNNQHALGTNLINNISQTVDPFGLLVILIGVISGTETIKYVLVFVQIIKVLFAAFLCRKYLKLFNVSEMAACLGAYLYAFSGHIMLWGQHYLLGTASVYIVLVLFCLENAIRKTEIKWRIGLSLSVAASVIYSYYMSYMILLFSGIYFCVRIFYPGLKQSWINILKKAINILSSVIVGLMVSGIILLPSASYLFNSSSRFESHMTLVERFLLFFRYIYPPVYAGQAASRLMSNNLLYINEGVLPGWGNYYEMPNLFYTVFIYLIFAQFVVYVIKNMRKSLPKTVYYTVCIFIVGFILLNPGIATAFNGFAYPQGRYMFVIIPILALMTSFVWSECIEKGKISILGVIGGLGFSFFVLAYSFRRAAADVRNYSLLYGIFILIFAIVMIYIAVQMKKKPYALAILAILFALTSMCDGIITNNQRVCVYKEEFTQEDGLNDKLKNTKDALDYLKSIDSSIYRVEKTYVDVVLVGDPLLEGYASITDYNSTANRHILDFYNNLYSGATFGDAFRIFNLNNPTDIIPMQLVNLKYLLTRDLIDYEGFEYFNTVGEVHIYKNKYANSIAHWYTRTISQDKCIDMSEEDKKNIVLNTAIVEVKNDIFSEGAESEADIGEFVETGSGCIEGNIENSEQGILMLAIPDQQGWEIYVDGVQEEIINVDYGFIGVELSPGKHVVNAIYKIPYLIEGIILSFAGIVLLLIQIILGKRHRLSEKR